MTCELAAHVVDVGLDDGVAFCVVRTCRFGRTENDAQQIRPIRELALSSTPTHRQRREGRPFLETLGNGRDDGRAGRRNQLGVDVDTVGRYALEAIYDGGRRQRECSVAR